MHPIYKYIPIVVLVCFPLIYHYLTVSSDLNPQEFIVQTAMRVKLPFQLTKMQERVYLLDKMESIRSRDFFFHNCSNRVRVGGQPHEIGKAPSDLSRIDGAWFLCLDQNLDLKFNNCVVFDWMVPDWMDEQQTADEVSNWGHSQPDEILVCN